MGGGIKAAYLGNKLVYGNETWWVEDRQNIVANFIVYLPPSYASFPFKNVDYFSMFINNGRYRFETTNSSDLSIDAGIDITINSESGYSGRYSSGSMNNGYDFDQHIAAQSQLTFQKYPDSNKLYLFNVVPEITINISGFSSTMISPKFRIEYYLRLYSEQSGITNQVWDNRGNDWFSVGSNGLINVHNIYGPQSKELTIPKDLYQIDLIFHIVFAGTF